MATEVDTPMEIVLDEGDIEALRSGEEHELVLDDDGSVIDKLVITWQVEGTIESDVARDINRAFSGGDR